MINESIFYKQPKLHKSPNTNWTWGSSNANDATYYQLPHALFIRLTGYTDSTSLIATYETQQKARKALTKAIKKYIKQRCKDYLMEI